MPTDVEAKAQLEHTDFMDIMSDYLYESIGAPEFSRRHPLIEKACVVVPSTAHISFTKAVTVLGLGKNSLIPVAVDENSRMDAHGTTNILSVRPVSCSLCLFFRNSLSLFQPPPYYVPNFLVMPQVIKIWQRNIFPVI